jgi:hypothetical protein
MRKCCLPYVNVIGFVVLEGLGFLMRRLAMLFVVVVGE